MSTLEYVVIEHKFGGSWTQEKLHSLQGYLVGYRSIFATNARAKFFTTWYVDAFAGTGSISTGASQSWLADLADEHGPDDERKQFLAGSAQIALGIPSPFHKYLFVEQSKRHAEALTAMVQGDFPHLANRVTVRIEDANDALCTWCSTRDWTKERAVVFLDPYGMQVKWNTIQTLAATQAVDLWYLFPFATRLLRNDQNIEETWSKRLDVLFGTNGWVSRFYPVRMHNTLFGEVESVERDATVNNIQSFIEERLKTCFIEVAKSRVLRNSTRSPLYALCFAASNPKGAKTALKIAQHLLAK